MFRFKRERQLARENKQLRARVDELSDELLRLTAQKNKTFKVQNAVRQAHAAEKSSLKTQLAEAEQRYAAEKATLVQQLAESEQQVEDLLMTASPIQECVATQTDSLAVKEPAAPLASISVECQTEGDVKEVEAGCMGITFAATPQREEGAADDDDGEAEDEDDSAFAPSAIAAAAAAAAAAAGGKGGAGGLRRRGGAAAPAVPRTPVDPECLYRPGEDGNGPNRGANDGQNGDNVGAVLDADAPAPPVICNVSDLAGREEDDANTTAAASAQHRHLDTTFNASTIGDWVDMNDVTTFAGDLNKTSIRSMYSQCMADISTARKVGELRGVGRLIRALIKRRLFSKEDFASLQEEYKEKMIEIKNPGVAPSNFEDAVDAADTNDTRRLKGVITAMKSELIKAKSTVARQSWQTEKLKLYCKERDRFILDLLQSPEKLEGRQTLLNQFLNRPSLNLAAGGASSDGPHFEAPPTPGGVLGPSPNTPFAVAHRGERNAALVDMVTQQDASSVINSGGKSAVDRSSRGPEGCSDGSCSSGGSGGGGGGGSISSASASGADAAITHELISPITTIAKPTTTPVNSAVAQKIDFLSSSDGCGAAVEDSPHTVLKGWSPGTLAHATPLTEGTPITFTQPTPAGEQESQGGSSADLNLNWNCSKYNAVARVDAPMTLSNCAACGDKAYAAERIVVDGHAYHKSCFKCSHCQKVVSAGSYAALNGRLFCKPHFKQIFKRSGNYDGGSFGTCSPARFKHTLDQSMLEQSLLEEEASFVAAVPPSEDFIDISIIETQGEKEQHERDTNRPPALKF